MTTSTPIRWKELSARERDALVAIHVGGRDDVSLEGNGQISVKGMAAFPGNYNTDIAAAFSVVGKMREKGYGVQIVSTKLGPTGYRVKFGFNAGLYGEAETLPEAICLAALTAIGLTIERE
jgi:hypothetical protein